MSYAVSVYMKTCLPAWTREREKSVEEGEGRKSEIKSSNEFYVFIPIFVTLPHLSVVDCAKADFPSLFWIYINKPTTDEFSVSFVMPHLSSFSFFGTIEWLLFDDLKFCPTHLTGGLMEFSDSLLSHPVWVSFQSVFTRMTFDYCRSRHPVNGSIQLS